MSIPKEVRDDTRPRHVRAAEQALRKGGLLRIDEASKRARLFDKNEDVVTRMPLALADECREHLEEEHSRRIITVRPGLYAGDVPDENTRVEEAPADESEACAQDVEKLTLDGILERWPALDAHYADARHQIGVYATKGKINKTSRGRGTPALYHIDDAFLAWIDSLPLDEYDVDEETPAAPPEEDEPQEAESEPVTGAEEDPTQDTAETESEDERLTSVSTEGVSAGDVAGDGSTGALQLARGGEREEASQHDPLDELWLQLHRAARTGDTGGLQEGIEAVRERLMQRVQELYTINEAAKALETDLDVVEKEAA